MLRCGVHTCPQRCHQLCDHSKVDCTRIVEATCPTKHRYKWKCHKGAPNACPQCEQEKRIEHEKRRRDFELELKRQERQREHARQLADVHNKIEEQKRILKDIANDREEKNILAQKMNDLEKLKDAAERARRLPPQLQTVPPKTLNSSAKASMPGMAQTQESGHAVLPEKSQTTSEASAAQDEWERQKRMEGQSNAALDSLMGMTGLEEVKDKFLSIKAKVDTVVRQNTSLKDERFSAALLGNPGTGMCLLPQKLYLSIEI